MVFDIDTKQNQNLWKISERPSVLHPPQFLHLIKKTKAVKHNNNCTQQKVMPAGEVDKPISYIVLGVYRCYV